MLTEHEPTSEKRVQRGRTARKHVSTNLVGRAFTTPEQALPERASELWLHQSSGTVYRSASLSSGS